MEFKAHYFPRSNKVSLFDEVGWFADIDVRGNNRHAATSSLTKMGLDILGDWRRKKGETGYFATVITRKRLPYILGAY